MAERAEIAGTPEGTVLALKAGVLQPAVGATVNVYAHGTKTPSTVFELEAGATALAQPIVANAEGALPGWLAAGEYDLEATYEGATLPVRFMDLNALNESVPTGAIQGSAVTLRKINRAELPRSQDGICAPLICFSVPRVGSNTATVTNEGRFMLAEVPQAGKIKKIAYAVSGVAGNVRAALYDSGQAVAGKYTVLGESGSVAMAGANSWQTLELASAVEVQAGQMVVLAVMNSGAAALWGIESSQLNAGYSELPAGSVRGVALSGAPKLCGKHVFGGFAFAAMSEAEFETSTLITSIFARVE